LKSIFEYDDFRKYLKDYYLHSKSINKNFSFRFFSRLAGFKSSAVLKHVIDGYANVATNSIEKYIKALKLNKEEAFFFENLVKLNQAETVHERQHYAELLLSSKRYKKLHPLSDSQFNYYSQWYFVPVRELVGMPGFKEDPEWIARRINPRITASEAKKAVEELLFLGLLERAANGRLIQTNANIATSNEVSSAFVALWHREMMKKAAESIDRHPREKREISAVTFKMSPAAVKQFKEVVDKFRDQVREIATNDHGDKAVYQMNLQLFPLTDVIKEGES
jgi:uncharacterized protein (TIGR02147 family)